MNENEPIKRGDNLYASCKTCGEVAPWVPYQSGQDWECQACREGTRQYGRAERERYLREKINPEERRERTIRIAGNIIALAIGALITWECLKWFFMAGTSGMPAR
jgi:hypothetical protein